MIYSNKTKSVRWAKFKFGSKKVIFLVSDGWIMKLYFILFRGYKKHQTLFGEVLTTPTAHRRRIVKNSDMPAMPIPLNAGESYKEHGPADGLTKREYMAGLAMQAMLTNAGRNGYQFDKPENLVGDAVNIADTLLARLGR